MAEQFDMSFFDGRFDPEDPLRWIDLSKPRDAAAYLFYQTWPKVWERMSEEGKAERFELFYGAGYPAFALCLALEYVKEPIPRSVVTAFEQSDEYLVEADELGDGLYSMLEDVIEEFGIDESK